VLLFFICCMVLCCFSVSNPCLSRSHKPSRLAVNTSLCSFSCNCAGRIDTTPPNLPTAELGSESSSLTDSSVIKDLSLDTGIWRTGGLLLPKYADDASYDQNFIKLPLVVIAVVFSSVISCSALIGKLSVFLISFHLLFSLSWKVRLLFEGYAKTYDLNKA